MGSSNNQSNLVHLKKRINEETKLKAAAIINEESNRMRRQVDEILELARMQAGQLKLAREAVNVTELLEHCREIFTVQAKEKAVEIRVLI